MILLVANDTATRFGFSKSFIQYLQSSIQFDLSYNQFPSCFIPGRFWFVCFLYSGMLQCVGPWFVLGLVLGLRKNLPQQSSTGQANGEGVGGWSQSYMSKHGNHTYPCLTATIRQGTFSKLSHFLHVRAGMNSNPSSPKRTPAYVQMKAWWNRSRWSNWTLQVCGSGMSFLAFYWGHHFCRDFWTMIQRPSL